ncbi:MAG: ABC transporter substrate-binding protein [Nostocales cyanobacterium]|nr:MAG: ABC transporter substrate-binding protein [Nostocales cyanobacterium]TAF14860.1 MAG: ABC transporter substrate-binding protein [Nostocales cyanobacterium]
MNHKSFLISLLLTVFLVSCATETKQIAEVNSEVKASVTTAQTSSQTQVQRVVALSSLSADIIAELDKTKLVGVVGSKILQNDPRFKDIPQITQGQNAPNLEKIVALKPDLVIGVAGFSDVPLKKLNDLGIKTLSTKIYGWEELEDFTKSIAEKIGADPQPLFNRYKSFLPDKNTQNKNTSTLVLVSRKPILAPNKESWAGDIVARFGAKNVAAELQGNNPIGGYVSLSAEKVLESNPDVLIVVNAEPTLLDSLKKEPFWQKLKATQNNQVYVFDYYGMVNPGSIAAIEKTSQELKKIF